MTEESKRRFARYRTDFFVVVTILTEDGYTPLHGRCHELNQAGLGAIISRELARGKMVSLELSLPGIPNSLVIRAIVRRRTGLSHGFEFELTAEHGVLIGAFCRSLIRP